MSHTLIVAGMCVAAVVLIAGIVLFGDPILCLMRRRRNWRRYKVQ